MNSDPAAEFYTFPNPAEVIVTDVSTRHRANRWLWSPGQNWKYRPNQIESWRRLEHFSNTVTADEIICVSHVTRAVINRFPERQLGPFVHAGRRFGVGRLHLQSQRRLQRCFRDQEQQQRSGESVLPRSLEHGRQLGRLRQVDWRSANVRSEASNVSHPVADGDQAVSQIGGSGTRLSAHLRHRRTRRQHLRRSSKRRRADPADLAIANQKRSENERQQLELVTQWTHLGLWQPIRIDSPLGH